MPLCVEGEVHGVLRLLEASPGGPPERTPRCWLSLRVARRGEPAGPPGARGRVRAEGAAARARVALRPRALARRPARSLRARRRGAVPLDLADRRGQGDARAGGRRGRSCSSAASAGRSSPPATAAWTLPEGGVINNGVSSTPPTAGMQPRTCQKYLAVAISVPGRRLGVLAVADKESRDGRVLDFTPTDARLLSLFANQAAAAIETARLHRDAIEKERIERELELRGGDPAADPSARSADVAGLMIAATNRPTRQVGGDYFDSLSAVGRAPRVYRGGRLGQGRARRAAGVDGARGGAPADRRGEDHRGPGGPHRPPPAALCRGAQVPDRRSSECRAGRAGPAALRLGRPQSGSAPPRLGSYRGAQGHGRAAGDVSRRLVEGENRSCSSPATCCASTPTA